MMRDLSRLYRDEPALHELDFEQDGFRWVDCNDAAASVVSLLRKSKNPAESIVVVCNFTPIPRMDYRVGVPHGGFWREVLNSDAKEYGGSGSGNYGGREAEEVPAHGKPCSLQLVLPPLGTLFLKAAGTLETVPPRNENNDTKSDDQPSAAS